MEQTSDNSADDFENDFAMDEQTMNDEPLNTADKHNDSRRRIEEMMERKRLNNQLSDFDDYDL
ncbi:MAG: hypothetical protein HUJ30_07990 [Gammaproteobacteria bacterium]|nr:hypothetical protein [Gammaproteobacteria bacterium]